MEQSLIMKVFYLFNNLVTLQDRSALPAPVSAPKSENVVNPKSSERKLVNNKEGFLGNSYEMLKGDNSSVSVDFSKSVMMDQSEKPFDADEVMKGMSMTKPKDKDEGLKIYENFPDHEVSDKDYEILSPLELPLYDKRNFKILFKTLITSYHVYLKVFMQKSLMSPMWIRILYLLTKLSLIFFFNAFLFTDEMISQRGNTSASDRVIILYK
jgi:hypothetical protein